MKVVILAGGYGTRISEESHLKPKPMLEIGNKPILWHIMKGYSQCGFNEFVICAGYKQSVIKEWFANYYIHNSDITFDFTSERNEVIIHDKHTEKWKVTVVDTGLDTKTGGRILRIKPYVDDKPFMMTYGDGVCDIDVKRLLSFHQKKGKIVTLTAVTQGESKGVLEIDHDEVIKSFREKSKMDDSRINGGFMVLEPAVFDYLEDDQTIFERRPLKMLSEEGQLCAYIHDGFWQCMDTKREMEMLQELWNSGKAPWKTWED